MYGEVYKHAQLNRATHHAIDEMFGVANMSTFRHLSRMVRRRLAVDHQGNNEYLSTPHNLSGTRIALLQGAENGIFTKKGSEKTLRWLQEVYDPALCERYLIDNYGHMDCFIGRDAATDVFGMILSELDRDPWPKKKYQGPDKRSSFPREYHGTDRR
jgi:cholesterol oxidase